MRTEGDKASLYISCKTAMVSSSVCTLALSYRSKGEDRLTSSGCFSSKFAIIVRISLQVRSSVIMPKCISYSALFFYGITVTNNFLMNKFIFRLEASAGVARESLHFASNDMI